MDFEVLILGSDANSYYMARCYYECTHKKAYLIGAVPLSFTSYSNILNITYNENLWNEEVFLQVLKDFRKKHDGNILLVSTNETYAKFISKNSDALKKDFYFNYPSLDIIETLMDKETFYKTYQNSKLKFPKTFYYDCKKNDKIPTFEEYPVIVKPSDVISYNHLSFEGKNKIYKVNSEEELTNVIERIKKGGYKEKLILQEFIPGGDDCLFDSVVYVNSKGKTEFISFAQIGLQERTKSMVGNAAVLINGFNTYNGDVDAQVKVIKEFMEDINYRGFAEVDMKYDIRDNTFKVLEINARQGRCSYYVSGLGKNLIETFALDLIKKEYHDFEYLDKKVLLSFVPFGIIKKYCTNEEFKSEVKKLWKNVIKPMACPEDKNFKRFLMLHKRWWHYYQEYKNSYWK